MKRSTLLALLLLAVAPAPNALAQAPPVADGSSSAPIWAGEIALEGEVRAINGATGEVTILATAFSTPNGRKEISPPKPKTLITTGQTRLTDLRLGLFYGLADLSVGLSLRAVGRDGGTGKPMVARALEWRSKVAPLAPDPATPEALRELLPPPVESKGVRVRVVDGGFQPENQIFDWSKKTRPTFFLSYRIFEPREPKATRPAYEWANLLGVKSPDGELLLGSGAGFKGGNRTLSFPKVNPQWKTVTAVFETTAADAPADSSGRFRGIYKVQGVLPTRENPVTKPGTSVTTRQGSELTLAQISCDWEKNATTYLIEYARPQEAPDAKIEAHIETIVDEQGRPLRPSPTYSSSQATSVSVRVPAVPIEGAKEAMLTLEVIEQDESWKRKESYDTVEVEVPVAGLLRANPPQPPVGEDGEASDLPVWNASNDGFVARLEQLLPGDNVYGLMWVAPATNDAQATQTLVERVTEAVNLRARDGEGKPIDIAMGFETSDETFFHSDGTAPVAGETVKNFNRNYGEGNTPTEFSLDVRSFSRLRHRFSARGLAVAPDSQRIVEEAELGETAGRNSLRLQKIAWLGAAEVEKLLLAQGASASFKGDSALVAVFDYTPIAPAAKIKLGNSTLRDETGRSREVRGPVYIGDLLMGTTTGALSLILPAPNGENKAAKIDLELRALETSEEGAQTATLEFAGVKWKP